MPKSRFLYSAGIVVTLLLTGQGSVQAQSPTPCSSCEGKADYKLHAFGHWYPPQPVFYHTEGVPVLAGLYAGDTPFVWDWSWYPAYHAYAPGPSDYAPTSAARFIATGRPVVPPLLPAPKTPAVPPSPK